MEINPIDIVQHVLNIVVLYLLLKTLLYKPVRAFMQQREQQQQEKLEQTQNALEQAQKLEQEHEKQLSQACIDAQEKADELLAQAHQEAHTIIEEAKAEAARLVEETTARMCTKQENMQQELAAYSAEMAAQMAEMILSREISKQDNERLISDYFRKVG